MQPIHLSYTPDRADFAALLASAPTPVALRIVFIGCVLAMASGLGWLSDNNAMFAALTAWSPPWGEVATVAVMVVAMYGVLMVLRRLLREFRAARAAAVAGPVAFAADGDGVSVTAAGRIDVIRGAMCWPPGPAAAGSSWRWRAVAASSSRAAPSPIPAP